MSKVGASHPIPPLKVGEPILHYSCVVLSTKAKTVGKPLRRTRINIKTQSIELINLKCVTYNPFICPQEQIKSNYNIQKSTLDALKLFRGFNKNC